MRSSGILMHISSLSSPYGIGKMGKCAREFVDFLVKSGQTYWQILPVCPTSYGDSPYQSFSTFAGNPYFIDFEKLEEEGYLHRAEYVDVDWKCDDNRVNYGVLYEKCYPVLWKAVKRFLTNPSQNYEIFCRENSFWLDDYAMFMMLKEINHGLSWMEWDEPLKKRDKKILSDLAVKYEEEIKYWKVLQYFFFEQWKELRVYANERGIDIIGDLPFYVALDSVDVWAHTELFQLNENLIPTGVAGCPPDGFSDTGQLWGNPLFAWEEHERTEYVWWTKRIGYLCEIYNVLRIDHFRAFDSYYSIPYGDVDAKRGHWEKGPGIQLFQSMEHAIGKQRIIAEDLGFMTESVRKLLSESGFPGMKVLEFAFDRRDSNNDDYLPHNYVKNCVAYVGTHDNETICGWIYSANPDDITYAKEYLRLEDPDNYHWEMMRALWGTVADYTIVQAQDLLGLGNECRMNKPSTLGGNWSWRALPDVFSDELALKLKEYMILYGRCK